MLSATALLFAGACSNDVIDPGAQNGSDVDSAEDGVYLAVNFDLPSAKDTRSYTTADGSSSGTEVGRDYENTVSEAYIVLARTLDNSFIAAARSSEPEAIGAANETSYRNTAKFTKTKLSEFYQKLT
ncbi:MAG: hypothetical protein K2K49_01945, partial [Duncaniella sp.]|nr:hypothetical protein [Duncaniella sp.]